MKIELFKQYRIGENKQIQPISIECELPSGNVFYLCEINRAGKKTTGIYYSGHVEALIYRFNLVRA